MAVVIRLIKNFKKGYIADDIMELLKLYDNQFVPPLSCRNSTTQQELYEGNSLKGSLNDYFDEICNQSILVALEKNKVIGFISFKKNYFPPELVRKTTPNIYITTLIVHEHHRCKGIASKLYHTLIKRFKGYNIYTRTWSTNNNHIKILRKYKFYECHRLENHRGEGIHTVYYHYPPMYRTIWQTIKQYCMISDFIFIILSVIGVIFFLNMWRLTDGSSIFHEISIAFSTSLFASMLCLASNTILKYRQSKNDEFINALRNFGIENIQFHKDELLEYIIPKCSREIWISGYRLIITAKEPFLEALMSACERHKDISIRLLTVAPWSGTYRLVYGEEDVTDNYIKVLYTLCKCMVNHHNNLDIRMTEKPIFNDTYKVDDRFVTSSYFHCTDENNIKNTAKDFFSFDINDSQKELYSIIERDYNAIWDRALYRLDCNSFYKEYEKEKDNIYEYTKENKLIWIRKFCKEFI